MWHIVFTIEVCTVMISYAFHRFLCYACSRQINSQVIITIKTINFLNTDYFSWFSFFLNFASKWNKILTYYEKLYRSIFFWGGEEYLLVPFSVHTLHVHKYTACGQKWFLSHHLPYIFYIKPLIFITFSSCGTVALYGPFFFFFFF